MVLIKRKTVIKNWSITVAEWTLSKSAYAASNGIQSGRLTLRVLSMYSFGLIQTFLGIRPCRWSVVISASLSRTTSILTNCSKAVSITNVCATLSSSGARSPRKPESNPTRQSLLILVRVAHHTIHIVLTRVLEKVLRQSLKSTFALYQTWPTYYRLAKTTCS